MKYAFQIVDVFSSTPFGGNQLAVLTDAAGISTEGMQKIAREFNFGETAFVLPKRDPNTYRVRIFSPRTELDFAGHPSVERGHAEDCSRIQFRRNGLRPAEEGSQYLSRAHLLTSDGARLRGASLGRHSLCARDETARTAS